MRPDTSLKDIDILIDRLSSSKSIVNKTSNKQVNKLITDTENILSSYQKRILRKQERKMREESKAYDSLKSNHQKTPSTINIKKNSSKIDNSYSSILLKKTGSICLDSAKSDKVEFPTFQPNSEKIVNTSMINIPEEYTNQSVSPFKIDSRPKIAITKKTSYVRSCEQSTIMSRRKFHESEVNKQDNQENDIQSHQLNVSQSKEKTFVIDSLNANKIYNKLKSINKKNKITKIVPRQKTNHIEKLDKTQYTSNKSRSLILSTVERLFSENNSKNRLIDYNDFKSEIKQLSIEDNETDSNNYKEFNTYNKYTLDIQNINYAETTYNKLKPLIEGTYIYLNENNFKIDFSATRLPQGLEQYCIKYKDCSIHITKLHQTHIIPISSLIKTLISKQLKGSSNLNYLNYPMLLELNDRSKMEIIFTTYSDFKNWLNGIAYLLKLV